jgi:uncharacterized protein YndB with AHSA1/START domain
MHELTEVALVSASIDAVFSDFTEAPALAEWFWPERFATVTTVEPVVGGAWRVSSEYAGLTLEAVVVAVEPPHALRLRWRWAGEAHATDAEIDLAEAAGGSTRVTVRHAGFLTDEERESHVEGWSHCLQRLVDRHGGAAGPA